MSQKWYNSGIRKETDMWEAQTRET